MEDETTNEYVFGSDKRQTRMCLLLLEGQTRMCVECVWNVCGLCLLREKDIPNAYVFVVRMHKRVCVWCQN